MQISQSRQRDGQPLSEQMSARVLRLCRIDPSEQCREHLYQRLGRDMAQIGMSRGRLAGPRDTASKRAGYSQQRVAFMVAYRFVAAQQLCLLVADRMSASLPRQYPSSVSANSTDCVQIADGAWPFSRFVFGLTAPINTAGRAEFPLAKAKPIPLCA